MPTAQLCITSPRLAPASQRPGARPAKIVPRCQACASFSQLQPASLSSTTSSFSSGTGAQLMEGPSCPWPAAQGADTHHTPGKPARGIWAFLVGEQDQDGEASALPPEVERIMRFTDAPGTAPEPQGWLSLWRYQGFK